MNDATPASPAGSAEARTPRRTRTGGLVAGALLAAVAGAVLGLMARPAPGRHAALAREALAAARVADAHRLSPGLYRRAELAYLAGGQAVARTGERWFPRYGEARAHYRQAAMLAADSVATAERRDLQDDRATIEETLRVLDQQIAAAEQRVADVETGLAEGDLPEAAARAAAAWSQLKALQKDLIALRLSVELREE
jgi:hypothetical protein